MTSTDSPSLPVPLRAALQPLWVQNLGAAPRGLALARESNGLLVWDQTNWLYLLSRKGERQAQIQAPGSLAAACCADDGSSYAAVSKKGEVWWLAPDLTPRWQRTVPQRAVAVALDPFGQYLAVGDSRGCLYFLDRHGRPRSQIQCPRPLHHLAFVPAAPFVVGSADYGLVACFDLDAQCVWLDGLVAHVGSLAVSGDGEQLLLACFTEGLQRYNLAGCKQGRLALGEPCRLAALAFDGRLVLAAGLSNRLHLLDRDGRLLCTHLLDKTPVALRLGALGDTAVTALSDGRIIALAIATSPA
jgi:hypothetical protein